jgi:hypothetical protein
MSIVVQIDQLYEGHARQALMSAIGANHGWFLASTGMRIAIIGAGWRSTRRCHSAGVGRIRRRLLRRSNAFRNWSVTCTFQCPISRFSGRNGLPSGPLQILLA